MNQNITKNLHQQIFTLALPMILSNITVPLLGLVDTAVIGHLSHAYYLGGAAVGAMIITFITWFCGFLRMSTTGMAAQAYGGEHVQENWLVLLRGLVVALVVGGLLIILQQPYLQLSLWLAGGSEQVQFYARQYGELRIWSLPAALGNLVLLGWLLGNQKAKAVMWLLVITNLINLSLDLVFVLVFSWDVQGIALATVIAEYTGFILALWVVFEHKNNAIKHMRTIISEHCRQICQRVALKKYFSVNRDIVIRTLCLECCFVFITFQGARLGDNVVAANAILLNFLLLISFGLDGIANAAEALVGQAVGQKKWAALKSIVRVSLCWTIIFALCYCLIFMFLGEQLIHMMTSIPSVISLANTYIMWLWLLPIVACWCYLYDGVYVGLMKANIMRNSMLVSTFLVFFPACWLLQNAGNHAIWAALSLFMLMRGLTLAWHFHYKVLRQ